MEDWLYIDIYFPGEPICSYEMERTSMTKGQIKSFDFDIFLIVFWYMHAYNISFVYADVGLERLVRMSPIARCVPRPIDVVAPY